MNTGAVLFNNNAASRLTAEVDALTTSIRVLPGEGEFFPQPVGDGSNWFMVTVEDRRTKQIEIMKCYGRSLDILNVMRGQEGTIAQAFAMGATVSNRLTAGTMETFFIFNGYSQVESDLRYVNVDGDTMTGPLVLPAAPTLDLEAATKKYVDDVSIDEAPTDGRAYARRMVNWIPVGVGLPEAPNDGVIYGRQDLEWIATVTKVEFDTAIGDAATDISALEARMSANETHDDDQDARLGSIELKNDQQDSRLQSVETINQSQDTRLASIESVNTAQDAAIAGKVSKAGDTMTGPLTVVSPPTNPTDAASKAYVDSKAASVNPFPEAPTDGQPYGRKNSTWVDVTEEAPSDTNAYGRKGGLWVDVTEEAPSDGLSYGRKNGGWATVVGGAYTDDSPPPAPLVDGQLWWDSAHGILYVYYQDVDGFQWVQTNGGGSGGAVVFTDDLAPANPVDGQMWWRSSLGQLMVYYDDGNSQQWVQASVATFPTDYRKKTANRYNMVVNGALNVSQENGNTEGTISGYYAADQFLLNLVAAGAAFGFGRVAAANPSGSQNRLRFRVTTAKATLAAGDFAFIQSTFEGLNVQDLAWSVAGQQKDAVLQFGFNGPAGTYCASIRNWNGSAVTHSFVAGFTVTAAQANTDTVQTIKVPAPPTTTWAVDNTVSIYLGIALAMGATNFAPSSGWQSGSFLGVTGMSNGLAAVQSFQIWDISLYADPDKTGLAPPFEIEDYAMTLAKCQRYFERVQFGGISAYGTAGAVIACTVGFKVPKRVQPTSGTISWASTANVNTQTIYNISSDGFLFGVTNVSAGMGLMSGCSVNVTARM